MANSSPLDHGMDWADRHVERWRGHWVLDTPFDDDTEAIFIRMGLLMRHLRAVADQAVRQVGLQQFEYETLHHLMIRETPGSASPTQLAKDIGISPAGMTGRLSSLEKTGWIRRTTPLGDRRRVVVDVTDDGVKIWRAAMALRGRAEEELSANFTTEERACLAGLLRRMTLQVEATSSVPPVATD